MLFWAVLILSNATLDSSDQLYNVNEWVKQCLDLLGGVPAISSNKMTIRNKEQGSY